MPSNNIEILKTILAHEGYRITNARKETFKLLTSPEPQSVRMILTKANKSVDRVSIYRNIELFEKLGIVHRIYVGWKYKLELSDKFMAHHHHLSCLHCGKIIDIEDERHINEFIQEVAKKFGFQAYRHQFEVEGYCKDCVKVVL